MTNKLISAVNLYEKESMRMTQTIKEDSVARDLLHQVLRDIENSPDVITASGFLDWLNGRKEEYQRRYNEDSQAENYGRVRAFAEVIGYIQRKSMM